MAAMAMEFLPRPARRWIRRNQRSVWKGLVAGAAGGLVGTIAMTQFQKAWQKAAEKKQLGDNLQQRETRSHEHAAEQQHEEEEDATMKAAGNLARAAGTELTHEQRGAASPFIHYGFGTAMGALWGVAMETSPRAIRKQRSPLFGSVFGSALFLGADEVAVPALGLAEVPEKPSSHLYAWASHLVYGLTAEFVRRQLRSRL